MQLREAAEGEENAQDTGAVQQEQLSQPHHVTEQQESPKKFKGALSILRTKDLWTMVLKQSVEKKKLEQEQLRHLREEKAKQEEVWHQWRIFMHPRKELAEMEKSKKEGKARQEVDAVKRRLVLEKEEREKVKKKKKEQRKDEKRKRKEEAEKRRK